MKRIKIKTTKNRIKRGDTLVEVTICFAIFSAASVGALSSMATSTANVQHSLETTIARSLIDEQSEALRFIHDATQSLVESGECYTNGDNIECKECDDLGGRKCKNDVFYYGDRKNNSKTFYAYLWEILIRTDKLAYNGVSMNMPKYVDEDCVGLYKIDSDRYRNFSYFNKASYIEKTFIINPYDLKKINVKRINQWKNTIIINSRSDNGFYLGGSNLSFDGSGFSYPSSYPKIVYGKMDANYSDDDNNKGKDDLTANINEFDNVGYKAVRDVQGIWVHAFEFAEEGDGEKISKIAQVNFQINACWDSPGSSTSSHLQTIIRLDNPFYKPE